MGYALPKIVGLLTPGGAIPAGVPAEVTRFLSHRSRSGGGTVTPRRVDAPPSRTPEQPASARWLWPALGALVVVGFLSYFWSTLNRIPSAPPVAKAPEPATPAPSTVAQAPSPPPAPSPAAQAPAPPPPPAAAGASACFDGNAGGAFSLRRAPALASTGAQATAPQRLRLPPRRKHKRQPRRLRLRRRRRRPHPRLRPRQPHRRLQPRLPRQSQRLNQPHPRQPPRRPDSRSATTMALSALQASCATRTRRPRSSMRSTRSSARTK